MVNVHHISQAPKQKEKFAYVWEKSPSQSGRVDLRRGNTPLADERPHTEDISMHSVLLSTTWNDNYRVSPKALQRLAGLGVTAVLAIGGQTTAAGIVYR